VSKSKQIGTKCETAVTRYAIEHGFPDAERLALRGNQDHGDVRLTAGLHVEVKGGKMADNASPTLISDWLEECDREAQNSGSFVFLCVKRKGYGEQRVGVWRAVFRLKQLDEVYADGYAVGHAAVEMNLLSALELLRARGFGEPLEY
jgi:hypothetical protein